MKKNKEKNKKIQSVPLYSDPKLPAIKEDFKKIFQKRISRIMAEFTEGYHFLNHFKKNVTIFGSTSVSEKHSYYQEARKLGRFLAEKGYNVITGGGPGIMEAANRGAFEAGGISIGINIELSEGQRMNSYVNRPIGFYYFFTRKVMLSFSSDVYVFFPGGFGTLDEFFEMVTLVQTKKLKKDVPIIVVKKEYWEPLFKWLELEVYLKYKAITKENLKIFQIVDSAQEAMEIIEKRKK